MTEFTRLFATNELFWLLCWQVPVAFVCVWCAAMCFLHRPRWRSWLWRLALLKCGLCLCLPVSLAIPLLRSEPVSPPAADTAAARREVAVAEPIHQEHITIPVAESSSPALPPRSPSSVAWIIQPVWIVTGLWLTGLALIVGVWLRGWSRLQRCLRDAVPNDDPRVEALAADLRRRMELPKPIEILVTRQAVSPMLIGWLRPKIVVPDWLLAAGCEQELRTALAHELAHVRRRDLFWNLLGACIGGLYFFHPLVWLALRRLRLSQESAADELAIRTTATAPEDYARILIRIAESARGMPAPHPALLTVSRSYLDLAERIQLLEAFQAPRRGGALLAAFVFVALVGIVPWHPVARQFAGAAAEPKAAEKEKPAEIKPLSPERMQEIDAAIVLLKDVGVFVQEFWVRGHVEYLLHIGTEKANDDFNLKDVEIVARGTKLALNLVNVKFTPAELKQLAAVRTIFNLELSGDNITDEMLAALPKLPLEDGLTLGDGPYTLAGMKHVAACQGVRRITLKGKHLTDDFLKPLVDMPNLAELSLQGPGFTSKAFEIQLRIRGLTSLRLPWHSNRNEQVAVLTPDDIARLTKLKSIDLSGAKYNDDTARALADHCPDLELIYLRRTAVTNEGVKELARLKKLKDLMLDGAKLDDGIADAIRQMKQLNFLSLDGCMIGDAAFAAACECPELRWLWADRTKVTDAGVKHVVKLPKLVHLKLSHNKRITDESLDVFKQLPNDPKHPLTLQLELTSISEDGIRELKAALPQANVFAFFPKDK